MAPFGMLIGLLVALVAAAPAGAADAARIAGTTTLAAGQAGYVPVQLEQPLRLVLASADENEQVKVKVDGGGLYGGLMLRLDDPSPDAPGIVSLRTPTFDSSSVSSVGNPAEEANESAWVVTLPAGRYRLYAIASDKPVAVTMTIPGMAGAAELRPSVAVPAVGEAFARRDPLPVDNIVVAGQARTLATPGLIAHEMLTTSLAGAAQQIELCTYPPGTDSTAPDAFTPSCPGGEAFSGTPAVGFAGYGLGSYGVVGAGEWGLGGNVQAAAAPAETVGYGFWMQFEGTPIPPAGTAAPADAGRGDGGPGQPAAQQAPAPASTAGGAPAAAKRKSKSKKKGCPRVTRRSSRAQRRKAARCRAAQRRAAQRRAAERRAAKRRAARRRG